MYSMTNPHFIFGMHIIVFALYNVFILLENFTYFKTSPLGLPRPGFEHPSDMQ